MRKFVIYANNGRKIELMCNSWELRHNGQTVSMLDEQQRPIAVFNFNSIIGVICDDLDEEDQEGKPLIWKGE